MRSGRDTLIFALTAIIFIFGLVQGFSIAARKYLWNDEVYSQMANVDGLSMGAIWRGQVREGNNAPLFYALQKSVCLALNYRPGNLRGREPFEARIILRIMPVIFMSLGLALIFWFFARTCSIAIGAVAFLTALGTYLVWAYFAEARPYAMIFFGGVLQSVLLLLAFRDAGSGPVWMGVAAVHVFLALTTPISVIQIAASCVMLWIAGYRRWWPLVLMVVLPLAIGFGYHQMYPEKYNFYFSSYGHPLALIKSAIPEGRLWFFIAAPLIFWFWAYKNNEQVQRVVWLFYGWFLLTLLGYGIFLLDLWIKQKVLIPGPSFEVTGRYMMSLAPMSAMVMAVLSVELLRRPKTVLAKVLVWSGILLLILPRLVKVFRWAEGLN